MKKLIILLAVLPLVLSSCLKDDKDAFGKTASERIREVQEGTEKALTGAANGWLMEYYPSATQEYGGIAIYMKFQNGTVTVTSEAGGAGKTAESLLVRSGLRSHDQFRHLQSVLPYLFGAELRCRPDQYGYGR